MKPEPTSACEFCGRAVTSAHRCSMAPTAIVPCAAKRCTEFVEANRYANDRGEPVCFEHSLERRNEDWVRTW